MKKIVVIILCLCCHIAAAQNIMKVEHHSFKSSTYHDTRSFRIALPTFAYPDTKYNVLLVLDADYMFDVIASSAIYLQTFDYIPPTAVVAVDYSSPGNRNDVEYDIISNSLNESGELFYKYINTDLENEIKRLIPTSGFNTLVGHSYTASYLNYWIGNDNDLISAYILFSPEEMQQIPDFAPQDNDAKPIIRIITGKNDTQERQDFGRRLFESLHEKHYDVMLDTVEADHMSVIPTGSTLALSRLYDRYYNIDNVYDIMDRSDESVWETFTRTNSHNMSCYMQEFPASGSFISAFLWTAIQNDDKESTSKLREYYGKALETGQADPNALGVMGDLMCKISLWKEADHYLQRCLNRYKELGQEHETLYWRRVYALKVLPELGQYKKAWKILEEGKRIYPDDKAIFSYYQGVLSVNNKFRMADGVKQLAIAIKYPDTLSANFIDADEAKKLLEKGEALIGQSE